MFHKILSFSFLIGGIILIMSMGAVLFGGNSEPNYAPILFLAGVASFHLGLFGILMCEFRITRAMISDFHSKSEEV